MAITDNTEKINELITKINSLPVAGTGESGSDGNDGFSPTIFVEAMDGGHNIVITDINGTQSFFVSDGENGSDGVSVVSVTQTTTSTDDDGENVITVTLSNGNVSTFKIKNGSRGADGASANINGVNTLTLNTSGGITKSQSGSTMTIGTNLTNILASGPIVLKEGVNYHYGDTLPKAGTKGRLFFKKVT